VPWAFHVGIFGNLTSDRTDSAIISHVIRHFQGLFWALMQVYVLFWQKIPLAYTNAFCERYQGYTALFFWRTAKEKDIDSSHIIIHNDITFLFQICNTGSWLKHFTRDGSL